MTPPPTKPTSARNIAVDAWNECVSFERYLNHGESNATVMRIESLILAHTAEVTKELRAIKPGIIDQAREKLASAHRETELRKQLQSAREVIGEAKMAIPYTAPVSLKQQALTHITEWQEKNK